MNKKNLNKNLKIKKINNLEEKLKDNLRTNDHKNNIIKKLNKGLNNELKEKFKKIIDSGNIYFAKIFAEQNNLPKKYQEETAIQISEKIIESIQKNDMVPEFFIPESAPEVLLLFNCKKEKIVESAERVCKYYLEHVDLFTEPAYAYERIIRIGKNYGVDENQFLPFAKKAYKEALKPKKEIILEGFWPKFAEKIAEEFLTKKEVEEARIKFLEEIENAKKETVA